MPSFYSPEWVDAFNEAVADLDVGEVGKGASLTADGGSFRVTQVVHGGHKGELVLTLAVEEGRLRLELGPEPGASPARRPGPHSPPQSDVVVSLAYEDAAAMSSGRLDPAAAVAEGRVRVRGDLAVLAASQVLLAAAADRLTALQADTTY